MMCLSWLCWLLCFRGKIKYYTHPPEQKTTHVGADFVTTMGKEFDIDSLLVDQQQMLQGMYHHLLIYHLFSYLK